MVSSSLNKILYAEDEPDISAIAIIALENIGHFKVKHCLNGRATLEATKDFTPDLLLLDVMMPEMDGPTVLKELRKIPAFAETPVVFMTAKIQSDEIASYKALGALEVISKPFDPMTLADTLKKIWENYKNKVKGSK